MRGLVAGKAMHKELLKSMLGANSRFFQENPTGVLLNRFSRDMNNVDANLPNQFDQIFSMFSQLIGALIVTAVITPLYATALVPVAFGYYKAYCYYQPAARDSNRLNAVNTSPLISHFSETLQGVATIRGFGRESDFVNHNRLCTDFAHRPLYAGQCTRRWMDLRLEMVNCLSITCTTGSIVMMARTFDAAIEPGLVGIAVKAIISNMMYLGWAMMNLSMLEANMNAVERISHYCDPEVVTQEKARVTGLPPASWPSQGKIDLDGLSIHYGDPKQLVLKAVKASIGARQKIGVVGRTGAGKSSLMNALFRLLEAADGGIKIDASELPGGEDIGDVGIHELRSKLAIIPQEPVLFSGTLRFNLDPFGEYATGSTAEEKLKTQDAALWAVLGTVHLAEAMRKKEGGLDHDVKEYGSNFSQGEKQVLCLARALLRKPRILVLDEATSSVDWDTDRLIQKTVRAQFSETTCLIIAHRLNTIIDVDRVMVLADGELQEFDSPANLLKRPGSYFASMVNEYGEEVAAKLTQQANDAAAARPFAAVPEALPAAADALLSSTGVDVSDVVPEGIVERGP